MVKRFVEGFEHFQAAFSQFLPLVETVLNNLSDHMMGFPEGTPSYTR